MKVYLVSAGNYSGWHIEGIFSTREKAEAFLPVLRETTREEINDIEEWEIDALAGAVPRIPHTAHIECESGTVRRYSENRPEPWVGDACKVWSTVTDGLTTIAVRSPISSSHAAKVAAEKRQEWLRVNQAGRNAT